MKHEELKKRLDFVVFGENHWRLYCSFDKNDVPSITYDAHKQSVLEAKKTIRNIVNIALTPIKLTVIHGFRHGTAIKEMLETESFSGRLTLRYCPVYNPGATIMQFAI